MKNVAAAVLLLLSLSLASFAAEQAGKSTRPAIYDRSADGTKQIEEALKIAQAQNKHVLLQFGANWCGWCHRLHSLFKDNAEIPDR
jgi:thioredoxin-related protein